MTIKPLPMLLALALTWAAPAAAATPSCPQDTWSGSIWNEYQAANASNSGAYTTGSTGGESYWTTTGNNTNDNTAIPTAAASGFSEQSFTITSSDVGYYKIEMFVQAPNGSSDSLFVGIVGQNDACSGGSGGTASSGNPNYHRWDIDESAGSAWAWRYVTDWNNTNSAANARVWYLTAGTYTLRIIGRETGTLVARVHFRRLTTGPTATPTPTTIVTNPPSPTRTRTSPPGSTPVSTSTMTPTPTAAPTVWAGLPASERLNGLEYIPFPPGRSGSTYIYDMSVTFTTAAANVNVRNTARWRITLTNMASSVGGQIQVETRLGALGEACTTGSMEPGAYAAATSLVLPSRPQNLSSTYYWVNSPVPYTERFDAVGDPRYMPYADLIGSPGNNTDVAGGYNWYFKDMTDSSFSDYQAEYAPFLGMAVNTRYNNQPNFDVPKLFSLWRESVIASRSIYTSMTGYSSYYIGLGGEIGGDSANKLSAGGVPCYKGPWGGSGSAGQEEIIGSAVLVRSSSWISRPWIGELWPDSSYSSDWSSAASSASWGNLRNNQQGGVAYRQAMQTALPGTGAAPYNFKLPQVLHRNQDPGCATFMNGSGGSGQFNHFYDAGFNASLLYDGSKMAQDYNFAMPATFNVNRSWGLNAGGNQPSEWNNWPYKGRRLALDIYSAAASQPATTWGFYQRDGGTLASQRASAAVRANDSTGVIDPAGQPAAGWMVINGLAPSTDSGINFVARFAILSCLRTFHDAGAPTVTGSWGGQSFSNSNNKVGPNTYRIAQVPLVQITQPVVGQDVTGISNIVLQWKTRSARWDHARYTENYPCLDQDASPCAAGDPTKPEDPAKEWHDDGDLVYNIKYSLNGGKDWASALTDTTAQPGVYMDGADSIASTPNFLGQYTWNVAPLPNGMKVVRVEAYRRALGLHYAYHEMSFKTAP
jgi:hypothetical protein